MTWMKYTESFGWIPMKGDPPKEKKEKENTEEPEKIKYRHALKEKKQYTRAARRHKNKSTVHSRA